MDIKKAWVHLIEHSGNPLMPFILQEAYGKVDKLGQAMAARASKAKVSEYWEMLTSAWEDDDELEEISGDPEFIIALAGMLCESLRGYVRKVSND